MGLELTAWRPGSIENEAVVPAQPDVVLGQAALHGLQVGNRGRSQVEVGVDDDLNRQPSGVRDSRRLAEALGVPARGEWDKALAGQMS